MGMRQVELTSHFDHFIDSGVRSGRFTDASEVVREGLRMLEQHEKNEEAKLERLKHAAQLGFEALDNGDSILLESSQELHDYLSEIYSQARSRLATPAAGK